MTAKARISAIAVVTLAVLTLLHHKPWQIANASNTPELAVGYLPVTCHLTCPVTDFATKTATTGTRFVSQRFTDYPTVVEALKARKIDATFILAPLAMVLREQGVPIHIVYLGHRDGSTVIVAKNSTAKTIHDLRGKTFARPSRFSNQFLVIAKLMTDEGMSVDDINFVDMAPPDMPAALATGAIDAYFVGEPFAAKAELDAAKRSLSDAREGHTHRLAELDAEHKRKAREIGLAEAEITRRLVTLGTLVNLNRIEDPTFAELYQRIDRLRGAITARTTEIEKLTAERDAYDRGMLVRGVSVIGGAFVALIALIAILRAIL